MKKLILKNVVTVVILSASYVGIASATTKPIVTTTVSGSLGTKATAVDIYQTTCSKNAAGKTGMFVARVKGTTAKGSPVSIQVHKNKQTAKATDAKSGDKIFSSYATIKNGGEGIYTINVDKSGAGIVNYVLESHCETAKGKATGQTKPKPTQNQ